MSLIEDYEIRWIDDPSAFKVAVVDPTISLTRALAVEALAAAKDMGGPRTPPPSSRSRACSGTEATACYS